MLENFKEGTSMNTTQGLIWIGVRLWGEIHWVLSRLLGGGL
ncbi:hypothetical protein D082_50140 (plasmid) [Synechocystis sp. PCC 6714]|nr:hypothetical protein D082_50140 [Synechocystis sp. PCC 6714]